MVGGGVQPTAVGDTASLQARLPQSLSLVPIPWEPAPLSMGKVDGNAPVSQLQVRLAYSHPKIQASHFNNLGPSWL